MYESADFLAQNVFYGRPRLLAFCRYITTKSERSRRDPLSAFIRELYFVRANEIRSTCPWSDDSIYEYLAPRRRRVAAALEFREAEQSRGSV